MRVNKRDISLLPSFLRVLSVILLAAASSCRYLFVSLDSFLSRALSVSIHLCMLIRADSTVTPAACAQW